MTVPIFMAMLVVIFYRKRIASIEENFEGTIPSRR